MKTKTFTLLVLFFFSLMASHAQYTVTLKVIDTTLGERSNDTADPNNTDANIIVWIDDNLKELNPRTPDDWWYPMYNNSGVTPDGNLIKGENAWTWELTLNVAPGEYEWNPNIKSYAWIPLRQAGLVNYEGESNNIPFTVAEDGTISGMTQVTIGDPLPTHEVVISIIDQTKGEITNGAGDWDEKNVYIWIDRLNNTNSWYYPLYEMEGTTGQLVKGDNLWTWQATFYAEPGTYEWNPYLGDPESSVLLSSIDIPGFTYPVDPEENLEFTVAEDGTITGIVSLIIPGNGTAIDTKTNDAYQVYPTVFSDRITVSGVEFSVELYNAAGIKVISASATTETALETATLAKGVYFLVIDGNATYKVIK